jgi:hypothetical protein
MEGLDMTGDQTAHITLTYKSSDVEYTRTYAISEDISRELSHKRNWLGGKLSGKALKEWLENKGCHLDSSDGPAYIWRQPYGTTYEWYHRDGKMHRGDGPAYIERYADGTTYEWYYRDDKMHREDGPARIETYPDGSTRERYFLDGVEYPKDEYAAKTNPLLTGLRLPPVNGGRDTIETLLREASEEQSAPSGRPNGREYIPLPHL